MADYRAVILADSGPQVGLGHLRRCEVVAKALLATGMDVRLLTPDEDVRALAHQPRLATGPWPGDLSDLPDADLLVVDSYRISAASCRSKAALRAQIVDLADDLPDVDLIINPNAYGDRLDYGRIGDGQVLAGADYALIDPEFAALRQRARPEDKAILVAFGGTDDGTLGAAVTNSILRRCEAHIELVASPLRAVAPAATSLARAQGDRVRLHHGARMLEVMAKTVLYVGACGSTVWEASAAGLGLVVAKTAENQSLIQSYLTERGLTAFPEVEADLMADAVAEWLKTTAPNPLTRVLDGRGGERVADTVLSQLSDAEPVR